MLRQMPLQKTLVETCQISCMGVQYILLDLHAVGLNTEIL